MSRGRTPHRTWHRAWLSAVGLLAAAGIGLVPPGPSPSFPPHRWPRASLPHSATTLWAELHARVVSEAALSASGPWAPPRYGRIVSPALAFRTASRGNAPSGQGDEITAAGPAYLVIADAPGLPVFGRRLLWLVPLAGQFQCLGGIAGPLPNPAGLAWAVVNARTGQLLQTGWTCSPGQSSG